MDHPHGLITTATAVLMNRYRLTEDDALDLLFRNGHGGTRRLTDLASWLIYDGDGHYYPEPHALGESG